MEVVLRNTGDSPWAPGSGEGSWEGKPDLVKGWDGQNGFQFTRHRRESWGRGQVLQDIGCLLLWLRVLMTRVPDAGWQGPSVSCQVLRWRLVWDTPWAAKSHKYRVFGDEAWKVQRKTSVRRCTSWITAKSKAGPRDPLVRCSGARPTPWLISSCTSAVGGRRFCHWGWVSVWVHVG